jgi:5-methylcytosine-specific restriction endonuclease McrA
MGKGLNSACKSCRNIYNKAYYAKNAEKFKAEATKWAEENPDKVAARKERYYAANREKILARQATYAAANLDKVRAKAGKRRARRLQATPVWADKSKIDEFYFAANFLGMVTGEWHHVDHIVPLNGKTVCGLHNEFNLQVLTGAENMKKGNRTWPGKP